MNFEDRSVGPVLTQITCCLLSDYQMRRQISKRAAFVVARFELSLYQQHQQLINICNLCKQPPVIATGQYQLEIRWVGVRIDAIDLLAPASLGEMPNEILLASASNWPLMGDDCHQKKTTNRIYQKWWSGGHCQWI